MTKEDVANEVMFKIRTLGIFEEMNDEQIKLFIDEAIHVILSRRFPFGRTEMDFPKEFLQNAFVITKYLLFKQGAEGQTFHSENDIGRAYESSYVPESMLDNIIPLVK